MISEPGVSHASKKTDGNSSKVQAKDQNSTDAPWLDPNGHMYSDDVLKIISRFWTVNTWERFLARTIDVEQSESELSSEQYESICASEGENVWSANLPSTYPPPYHDALKKSMRCLTGQQTRVIKLLFWKGLSVREAAKSMGVGRSLVSIQKKNSLKKLKYMSEIELAKFPLSEREDKYRSSELAFATDAESESDGM